MWWKRGTAFAFLFAIGSGVGCGGGSGGHDATGPGPVPSIAGDWLITKGANANSPVCNFYQGHTPDVVGVRLTVVGDQLYGGSGASCSQSLQGTLADGVISTDESGTQTYYSSYPGYCTYSTSFQSTVRYSDNSISGTYRLTRTVVNSVPNELGDVCLNLYGRGDVAPCSEEGTITGTRCTGCTGCP